MQNSKQFYKDLPKHNGYKWFGFHKGFYLFTKHIHGEGWIELKLVQDDIDCPLNFKSMLDKELTR